MRIRAFIAFNFPVAVTRRVAEEVARHHAAVHAAAPSGGIAWVPPANLHVTLKFLGATPEEAIEAVAERLKRVAARHPPFEARAVGVGAFPSLESARVLWVGVEGGDALAKLARDVEGQMIELGYPKEARAYHAHLTVGRILGPRPKDGVGCNDGAALGSHWASNVDCGTSTIHEMIVYESRTLSAGAEYVARARVTLGMPA